MQAIEINRMVKWNGDNGSMDEMARQTTRLQLHYTYTPTSSLGQMEEN